MQRAILRNIQNIIQKFQTQFLTWRLFCFIYCLGRTTHQPPVSFFQKLHLLRQSPHGTSNSEKFKTVSRFASSKLNLNYSSVTSISGGWYPFHRQHVTCFQSYYLVPHSNRYHFCGMSTIPYISTCSFSTVTAAFSPTSALRFHR